MYITNIQKELIKAIISKTVNAHKLFNSKRKKEKKRGILNQ